MARRRCQYCTRPLGLVATLLLIYRTCSTCAHRLSLGHVPARPPAEPAPPLPVNGAAPTT